MEIHTTETIPHAEVTESLGVVIGNTIRSKNMFRDIGAALKSLVGGELKDYTRMMEEAREEALKRMMQDASEKGADAVVNVRMTTSTVIGGAAEVIAYGTAVKVKK